MKIQRMRIEFWVTKATCVVLGVIGSIILSVTDGGGVLVVIVLVVVAAVVAVAMFCFHFFIYLVLTACS